MAKPNRKERIFYMITYIAIIIILPIWHYTGVRPVSDLEEGAVVEFVTSGHRGILTSINCPPRIDNCNYVVRINGEDRSGIMRDEIRLTGN